MKNNKKGFIATSIIYSFFIVFLMMITLNLVKHEQKRILLDQIKADIRSDLLMDITTGPTCIRAKTLHTEICNNISPTFDKPYPSWACGGNGYASGATITYGSLGTIGNLKTGDAFDCDVNGDGNFDATTERFYYVSKLSGRDDVAVMLYYSGVVNGSISYSGAPYNNTSSWDGPIDAKNNLPSNDQWKNVQLFNSVRNIYGQSGELIKANFSYSGRAARLLSLADIKDVCGTTDVRTNCRFIMEGTQYADKNRNIFAIRLEEAIKEYSGFALQIYVYNGSAQMAFISSVSTNSTNGGVKPVIEVPLENIDY